MSRKRSLEVLTASKDVREDATGPKTIGGLHYNGEKRSSQLWGHWQTLGERILPREGEWSDTYCRQLKIRGFFLDKVPGSFFRKGFAGIVAIGRIFKRLFQGDWVPIFLRVDVTRTETFQKIDDCRKRASYNLKIRETVFPLQHNRSKMMRGSSIVSYNTLDSRSPVLNRFQQPYRPHRSRIKKIPLNICNSKMKRRRRVDHDVKRRIRHNRFIERAFNRNILDYDKIYFIFRDVWMCVSDF